MLADLRELAPQATDDLPLWPPHRRHERVHRARGSTDRGGRPAAG
jgi:hypothetical protein